MGGSRAAEFPISVTDDASTTVYLTPREIESDLEFYDEYQGQGESDVYAMKDARGRRVRLIVWRLQLLLCQVLEDDDDPSNCYVAHAQFGDDAGLVEMSSRGGVLRAVFPGGRAYPSSWDQQDDTSIVVDSNADVTVRDFHAEWMRARVNFP